MVYQSAKYLIKIYLVCDLLDPTDSSSDLRAGSINQMYDQDMVVVL